MEIPKFTSVEPSREFQGNLVFGVLLDRDTDDLSHIIGHKVEIDGVEYDAIQAIANPVARPWDKGDPIAIIARKP